MRELYLALNRHTSTAAEIMSMTKTGLEASELRCQTLEDMLERQNARLLDIKQKFSSIDDWASDAANIKASWSASAEAGPAEE